jgi:hypothetical protein
MMTTERRGEKKEPDLRLIISALAWRTEENRKNCQVVREEIRAGILLNDEQRYSLS